MGDSKPRPLISVRSARGLLWPWPWPWPFLCFAFPCVVAVPPRLGPAPFPGPPRTPPFNQVRVVHADFYMAPPLPAAELARWGGSWEGLYGAAGHGAVSYTAPPVACSSTLTNSTRVLAPPQYPFNPLARCQPRLLASSPPVAPCSAAGRLFLLCASHSRHRATILPEGCSSGPCPRPRLLSQIPRNWQKRTLSFQ